jgi:hypothetical protein
MQQRGNVNHLEGSHAPRPAYTEPGRSGTTGHGRKPGPRLAADSAKLMDKVASAPGSLQAVGGN